jgi:hypothetical protein
VYARRHLWTDMEGAHKTVEQSGNRCTTGVVPMESAQPPVDSRSTSLQQDICARTHTQTQTKTALSSFPRQRWFQAKRVVAFHIYPAWGRSGFDFIEQLYQLTLIMRCLLYFEYVSTVISISSLHHHHRHHKTWQEMHAHTHTSSHTQYML